MAGKVAQVGPVSLGITTDVTPLKIVGLNNYRRLQGDKLAQVAQFSLGGRGNKDAAALPSLMLMVIVMLGVATIDTLDVTPLKIVGLNNYT